MPYPSPQRGADGLHLGPPVTPVAPMPHGEMAVPAERDQVGVRQLRTAVVDGVDVVDLQILDPQARLTFRLALQVRGADCRPLART